MNTTFFAWCVKDEDGVLRPRAGFWEEDALGSWKFSTEDYLKSKYAKNCSVVRVEVTELK